MNAGRVVTGKIELIKTRVSLREIVSGVLDTVSMARQSELPTIARRLEEVYVLGDATRLEQIVGNLVGNAIKYTPVGGTIDVVLEARSDWAVLRVSDTGIGISTELQPKIFDLFVQGDAATGHLKEGLGIGLALVKRLVDLHDGTVCVHSEGAGTGSCFQIELPRVDDLMISNRLCNRLAFRAAVCGSVGSVAHLPFDRRV